MSFGLEAVGSGVPPRVMWLPGAAAGAADTRQWAGKNVLLYLKA